MEADAADGAAEMNWKHKSHHTDQGNLMIIFTSWNKPCGMTLDYEEVNGHYNHKPNVSFTNSFQRIISWAFELKLPSAVLHIVAGPRT